MHQLQDPQRPTSAGPHSVVKLAARLAAAKGYVSTADRLALCKRLLVNDAGALALTAWGEEFRNLPRAERHYRISALYMLLMPPRRRQQLAAYFTPPHLCDHILDRLRCHGYDIERHRVLDPASGGAAFLVPVADRLLAVLKLEQHTPFDVLRIARDRLAGVEIEPGLANLSELLLADVFSHELKFCNQDTLKVIRRKNALKLLPGSDKYDIIISNPPYGRVFRASKGLLDRWSSVISDGHVNTYAIFIALAFEQVNPGGIISIIVPTSFLSGPYFEKLRTHILAVGEVLELNIIDKRSDEFIDVVQDTCVLMLRKRDNSTERAVSTCRPSVSLLRAGSVNFQGDLDLPDEGGRAWVLPSVNSDNASALFNANFSNLELYGYTARAGYFVWNRSKDRLADRTSPLFSEVPLIWAHNIRPGEEIRLATRPNRAGGGEGLISFVTIQLNSPAIQRTGAIILQRTTNRSQRRRLVAGLVSKDIVEKYGGYVTENHTIVVAPKAGISPVVPIDVLLQVLNSSGIDRRYRRLAGTVSVSTKVLRSFPLPPPEQLLEALKQGASIEEAIELAYQSSSVFKIQLQFDLQNSPVQTRLAG